VYKLEFQELAQIFNESWSSFQRQQVFVLDWTTLGISIDSLYRRRERSVRAAGGFLGNRRREVAILSAFRIGGTSELRLAPELMTLLFDAFY